MIMTLNTLDRVALYNDAKVLLDWEKDTPLKVTYDLAQQALILTRHTPHCVFCGEHREDRLIPLKKQEVAICHDCVQGVVGMAMLEGKTDFAFPKNI